MKTKLNSSQPVEAKIEPGAIALRVASRIVPAWFCPACRWFTVFAILIPFLSLGPSAAQAQGVLTDGAMQAGNISSAGQVDSWTFSATAGAGIMVRVGAANLTPKIQVFDPGNALIGQIVPTSGNTRDSVLTLQATNGGNYTVLVSATFPTQTGAYGLSLAVAPGTIVVSPGDEGGALTNGVLNAGNIPVGDLDVYSFTANAGDGIMLRMASSSLTPWIRLYEPNGALAGEAPVVNANTRDAVLTLQATNSGTYTVVVGAFYASQTGSYQLTLAHAPGAIFVSPGDEGGALTNGVLNVGNIPLGDLDVWSFNANAGDGLMLRMASPSITPWIRLYAPNGALAGEAPVVNANTRDAVLTLQATNSGTYTVVVGAVYAQTGTYELTLAQVPGPIFVSPGDEGGPLTNGVVNAGNIPLGDLDLWSFTANAGDGLMLRMGSPSITPWIRLYGPNGALAGEAPVVNANTRDAVLTLQATNSGTYTVVVAAVYAQTGTYELTLAQVPGPIFVSPGDEGGPLTNGVVNAGNIPLGDLDLWSFTANAGDGLMLRMGSPTLTPWIRLYGPTGALAGEAPVVNANTRDAVLTLQATNSGTYTVVLSAFYASQTGTYELTLAQAPGAIFVSPGDEGGPLVNGVTNSASLNLGDLDVWSFFGTAGDSNVLRVAATSFTPWIRLYGPNGSLAGETTSGNGNVRSGFVTLQVTNSGVYTVVVSATYEGQSGTYTFKQSRWAPDLIVPETTTINESTPLNVSISAQDPDVAVTPLIFKLISAPPGVSLSLAVTNATLSWATTEADGPSTNTIVVSVTDVVNGRPFVRTNSFTVVVNEINTPPQLTLPPDQVIDELTPLINVKASATDADFPPNPLTFSLIAPPTGMTIDPASGAISWTPTEAQGPSANTITVVVTDDSPSAANAQHLSATNSFTIVVNEVNTPPVLPAQSNLVVDELITLTVTNTATDADLPANTLTYTLLAAPTNATISVNGVITWTPSEAQGPSTNTFTTMVADNGSPSRSATNSFSVVVNEVNAAPVLLAQNDRVIEELTTLSVTNTATDADIPANTLTYTMVVGPTNATISATGLITWSPTEAQGPSTNTFTTVVTDNGSPSRSATNSFTVVVNEVNVAPVLPAQSDHVIDELTTLSVTNTATDADIPANTLTYAMVAAPTNATISATGLITWSPTEAQGPSTNTFTTVVTDNGSFIRSATNSFTVVVNEVNTRPVLQPIADTSLHFGTLLSIQAAATDADLPANTLTFSLDQAPTNLTINATNGSISWTPSQEQIGAHAVTVRVTDNGLPSLNATNTFQVTVTGEGSSLEIQRLASGLMQLAITADLGQNYELQKSTDLQIWDQLFKFQLSTSPFQYIDIGAETNALRFYRLKLVQ